MRLLRFLHGKGRLDEAVINHEKLEFVVIC